MDLNRSEDGSDVAEETTIDLWHEESGVMEERMSEFESLDSTGLFELTQKPKLQRLTNFNS